MLSGKNSKWLVVLLSAIVAVAANAAPTLSTYDTKFPPCNLSSASNTYSLAAIERNQTTELFNSHLATIDAEFLKPPTNFMDSLTGPTDAKSLPHVPGALFMALVGFGCVSLVKDRQVWMAVLAGLLWVSQAGFTALPQLVSHLASKKQIEQQVPANLTYARKLEEPDQLRSDIEETRYIGLLHHSARIPDGPMSFLTRIRVRDKLQQESRRINHQFKIRQSAIMRLLSYFIPLTNCLAPKTEQFICFSLTYILENLPRGPPTLA